MIIKNSLDELTKYIRVDSNGRMFIGTYTPQGTLTVNPDTTENIAGYFGSSNTQQTDIVIAQTGYNVVRVQNKLGNLTFSTGASSPERMRIDSSGNVGIGTVPKVITAGYRVLDFANTTIMSGDSGNDSYFVNNAYFDGAWKYKISGKQATRYESVFGAHRWYMAPAGTADGTIPWAQGAEITDSGVFKTRNTMSWYAGNTSALSWVKLFTIGNGLSQGTKVRVDLSIGAGGYSSTAYDLGFSTISLVLNNSNVWEGSILQYKLKDNRTYAFQDLRMVPTTGTGVEIWVQVATYSRINCFLLSDSVITHFTPSTDVLTTTDPGGVSGVLSYMWHSNGFISTPMYLGDNATSYSTTSHKRLNIGSMTAKTAIELSSATTVTDEEVAGFYITNQQSGVTGRGVAAIKGLRGSTNNLGQLAFYTQGGSGLVERMRITSDGTAQVTTAGQGLKLPNSASSDTTTLDWYEEGTWTPAIGGGTTTGTASYTTQVGRYTRVGNKVTVHFNVTGTFSVAPTGEVRISGIPFTSQNTVGLIPSGSIVYGYGTSGIGLYLLYNTSYLKLLKNSTSIGANSTVVQFATDYSNSNFSIQGTITYQV